MLVCLFSASMFFFCSAHIKKADEPEKNLAVLIKVSKTKQKRNLVVVLNNRENAWKESILKKKKAVNGAKLCKNRRDIMSPRELSYIEDALGHEKFLRTQCQEAMKNLQDPELKSCVEQFSQKHQQMFDNFYNLI